MAGGHAGNRPVACSGWRAAWVALRALCARRACARGRAPERELVEEAVLAEFERIAERGGVLGAMETGYQRGRIQDESMHYEHLKHTG
ncbi:MAG: methylmalonyl-CoA mutase family protein, partial [Burkholderiaceae bacterium]|nr:methylmalonyl-CoA mutase family protein [Burkholderiales bacterium]MCZ8336942.1 methylmalonyl-CoA mutase family protein [Burkholderiaceae bacterium]